MDMDDDDFMGEIEFDLSPEQQKIVGLAISLASEADEQSDPFMKTNPLISIMQWWEMSGAKSAKPGNTPEATLAEICQQFVLAHGKA